MYKKIISFIISFAMLVLCMPSIVVHAAGETFTIADFRTSADTTAWIDGSNVKVTAGYGSYSQSGGMNNPDGGTYGCYNMSWIFGAVGDTYLVENKDRFGGLDFSDYDTIKLTSKLVGGKDIINNYFTVVLSTNATPFAGLAETQEAKYTDECLTYEVDMSQYTKNEWKEVEIPLKDFITQFDGQGTGALADPTGSVIVDKTPLSAIKSISIYAATPPRWGGVGTPFIDWAFKNTSQTTGTSAVMYVDSIVLESNKTHTTADKAMSAIRKHMSQYDGGIMSDIDIPRTIDGLDAQISWVSDNELILDNFGNIGTLPERDTIVKLKATVNDGTNIREAVYNILVFGTVEEFIIADFSGTDSSLWAEGTNFGNLQADGSVWKGQWNASGYSMNWLYGATGEGYLANNPERFGNLDFSDYSALSLTFTLSTSTPITDNHFCVLLSTNPQPSQGQAVATNPDFGKDEILAYAINCAEIPINQKVTIEIPLKDFVSQYDGMSNGEYKGVIGDGTKLSDIKSISLYLAGGYAGSTFTDWLGKGSSIPGKSASPNFNSISLIGQNNVEKASKLLDEQMAPYLAKSTTATSISLPDTLSDTDIEYTSNSPVINAETGEIRRPKYTTPVTLEAKISNPLREQTNTYTIYVQGTDVLIDAGEQENGDFVIAAFHNYDTVEAWKNGTNHRNGENLSFDASNTYEGASGALNTDYALPANGEAYMANNPDIFGNLNFADYEKISVVYYNSTSVAQSIALILSDAQNPSAELSNTTAPDYASSNCKIYEIPLDGAAGWHTIDIPFSDFTDLYGNLEIENVKSISLVSGSYANQNNGNYGFYDGNENSAQVFVDSITLKTKPTNHEAYFTWLDEYMSAYSNGITDDITLPTTISNVSDASISWTSESDVLSSDGKVTEALQTTVVSLLASVTSEGITRTRSYDIVVKSLADENYYLAYDAFGTSSEAMKWGNNAIVKNGKLVLRGDVDASRVFYTQDEKFNLTGKIYIDYDISTSGNADINILDLSDKRSVRMNADSMNAKYFYTSDAEHLNEVTSAFDISTLSDVNTNIGINIDSGALEIKSEGNSALNGYTVEEADTPAVFKIKTSGGAETLIDNFRVYIPNSDRLGVIKQQLTWDKVSISPINEVKTLNLFTDTILGVKIEWSSDNEAINTQNGGTVNFDTSAQNVKLTAKLYKEENPSDCEYVYFNVTVPALHGTDFAEHKTVTGNITADTGSSYSNLTDGDPLTSLKVNQNSNVASRYIQLDLENEYPFTSIYINENKVNNVYPIKNYTISISKDGNSWTEIYKEDRGGGIGSDKKIDVIPTSARYIKLKFDSVNSPGLDISDIRVSFDLTPEEIIAHDKDAITSIGDYAVSSNLTLPLKGEYGSSITWVSDHPEIITNDGVFVKRPTVDTVVIMTATVSFAGVSTTKQFKHIVRAATVSRPIGGGGGGGGSSSGGNGGKVNYIPSVPDNATATPVTVGYFDDLGSVSWAVESINALAQKNAISGVSERRFMPERTITREEFVKILISALEIEVTDYNNINFNDCTEDEWYYAYLSTALNHGLIKGVSESEFGIGKNITRQDIAVILNRAGETFDIQFADGEERNFNDYSSISNYARDAVDVLSKAGIINGDNNGCFNPANYATRAEAAKMIYGVIK